MTGPDSGAAANKDSPDWWPCARHRPANIVPFDRPVITVEGSDSPPPAFNDRAVSHPPVVTIAGDGR